jgi:BASS family bile acid:Na+ symporter
MLQRFLLVWLVLLSAVAYLWPDHGPSWDPFAATKAFLPWMITATMFFIGGLLPRDEIRQVLRRWPQIVGGTFIQCAGMPLLAYIGARAAGWEGDLLVGVILVGCVPGAMASNVLTLMARGNVSYSVSLTTCSTLLSPVFVPLALLATLNETSVDSQALAARAFRELLLQVALPVLAGYALSRNVPAAERVMRRVGPTAANLTILWIIAVVVNLNHEKVSTADPHTLPLLVATLLAVNVAGYLAGALGGTALRLPADGRRALTLEIGMQNAGLGATLATQLFPGRPLVALPAALYMFGCMLTGTMLAQWWSRRPVQNVETSPLAPQDEPSK